MAETFAVKIAREQAKLKRQALSATAAPRLQHASLDDTDLPMYDRAGELKGSLGKQPDGSFGQVVRNSPDQPTLTAPILPEPVDGERVPNNFPVEWDGAVVAGVVPEVHGRTDVWYQMADTVGSVDPSAWRLGGSIRDRLGGATTIVVPGTGMVAVAFQMVGADRTTKGEFSAPAFVTVTARVDAQDIADRLNEFADGELPDGAYENLLARMAEFLHVRADQIDVNSLAADTAFIALLETAGIILADEAAGQRTEVSGQGLTITDTVSGEVLTQLGTFTDSLFTIMGDNGAPAVTMTQAGGVSALQLSSQGDPTFGGKPLAGAHANTNRWHVVDNVVDLAAQGATVYWPRVFNSETYNSTVSAVGVGVTHLEATLRPNRIYKFKCHNFDMADRTNYWMQAHMTTSEDMSVRPPRPHTAAGGTATAGPRVHGTVPPSSASSSYGTSLSYEWVRTFAHAQRVRIIFAVGNSSGVPSNFGNLTRHRAMFSIEDVGPSTGPKGYSLGTNMNYTTDNLSPLPDDLSQSYGVSRTATYTLNTTTRMATRQYYDGTPHFGRRNNGTWYLTLVEFADWSEQPGVRQYGQFYVSVASWSAPGRGHIFQSAVPTFTGLPASFNFDTQLMNMPDQQNVSRWAPRQVGPSGAAVDVLLDKPRAAVAIGRTGWGALDGSFEASGILTLGAGTNARLSTELGGGVEE